ncbi:hypothetical protein D3C86_1456510 [compost metagenome]
MAMVTGCSLAEEEVQASFFLFGKYTGIATEKVTIKAGIERNDTALKLCQRLQHQITVDFGSTKGFIKALGIVCM